MFNQSVIMNETHPKNMTFFFHPLLESDRVHIYIAATIGVPLLLLSALGNLMTLAAIIYRRWWKTGLHLLILNLTLADIFSSCYAFPATLLNMAFGEVALWANRPYCMTQAYFFTTSTFIPPTISCMIALIQFFNVVTPRAYQFLTTRKSASLMILFANLLVFLPFLFVVTKMDGFMGTIPPFNYCGWAGYASSPFMIQFVPRVSIFGSAAVICICYSAIFAKLLLHDRKVMVRSDPSGLDLQKSKKYQRRLSIAMTMSVSFFGFIVSYLPLIAVFQTYSSTLWDSRFSVPALLCWLYVVFWMGTCLTPICYWTLNKDFRAAYVDVWNSWVCRRRGAPRTGKSQIVPLKKPNRAEQDGLTVES